MFFKENPKDIEKEIQKDYRSVFTSREGRKVLTHMLAELHFFDELQLTDEEIMLSNYAKRLLSHIGVWKGMNVQEIVNAFIDIKKGGEK